LQYPPKENPTTKQIQDQNSRNDATKNQEATKPISTTTHFPKNHQESNYLKKNQEAKKNRDQNITLDVLPLGHPRPNPPPPLLDKRSKISSL